MCIRDRAIAAHVHAQQVHGLFDGDGVHLNEQRVDQIEVFPLQFAGARHIAIQEGVRHICLLYTSFLDLPNRKYQGTLPVEKRAFCQDGDMEYEIELRNVSFRYPGSEAWALRGVSARLCAGDKVAIVGPNGSGKTTLIKLLCRLYDPDEGEILLTGIDIRKYDYEEYLRLFSVVFQDFRLLAFPLGENVAASQAVSYTHLDVYKRQVHGMWEL